MPTTTTTSTQDSPSISPWLTVEQCLQELAVPRSTWEKWRQRNLAPRTKRLPNGQLRIHRDWLDHWINSLPEQP